MKTTKLIFVAAVMALMVPVAFAQTIEKENFSYSVGDNSKLKFENLVGDLKLSGWDRPEIKIEVIKKAKGNNEKALLDALKVNVSNSGSTVVISVDYPSKKNWKKERWGKNTELIANFEIYVPFSSRVVVDKVVAGDVEINDISGTINVGIVSGDLTAKRLSGNVTLSAVSGDIKTEELYGECVLTSVSGGIYAENVTGSLKATATNGDITVKAIDLEEAKFQTTSGEVYLDIASAVTFGTFAIDVMNGEIEMIIPAASAFDAFLKVSNGEVSSDFDLKRSRAIMKNLLKGEVNGGGASIVCTVFNGEIELKSK